jgi:hypothetical protein
MALPGSRGRESRAPSRAAPLAEPRVERGAEDALHGGPQLAGLAGADLIRDERVSQAIDQDAEASDDGRSTVWALQRDRDQVLERERLLAGQLHPPVPRAAIAAERSAFPRSHLAHADQDVASEGDRLRIVGGQGEAPLFHREPALLDRPGDGRRGCATSWPNTEGPH